MRITVVRPDELGAAELDRWRAYQRATPALANPFLAPEFALAAGRVRPQTRVAVLDDGEGFLPFERGPLGNGTPVAPGLNDLHGVVHAPGLEWDTRALLRACRLAVWEFDHLVDGQQPAGSQPFPSPVLDLSGGFGAYREQVQRRQPADRKQSLGEVPRKERRLARRVGEVRVDCDTADPALLRTLMAWKSVQYQQSGTWDRFARGWIVALLEELLVLRTSHFAAELNALHAGDHLLAAALQLRAGPVVAHWFPAHDPAFGQYSPGMVLLWRGVEAAAAGGVQRLSLGRGPEPYKQIVKTGDEHVHEGRFARWSSVATAYRVRREGPRRLRQVVVANPKLYAVADPVRRQAGRLDAAVRRLASKPYGQTSGVVNGQPTSGSCRPSTDIDQALGRTE